MKSLPVYIPGPAGLAPAGPAAVSSGRKPHATAPRPAEVKASVRQINAVLQALSSDVRFTFDPAARESVVQVVDPHSHKVIHQIPSREALAIAQALNRLASELASRPA